MTDAIISLTAILLLCCAVVALLEGGIQINKWYVLRKTRQEQARQWAAHTRWMTEQQQRRQHQRAVRNSNN